MRRTRRLILLLILGIVAVVGVSWRIQKGLQAKQTPAKPASLPDSVSARAEAIVSGDDDLLVLHPFRGVAILTPKDFLTRAVL